MRTSTLTLWLTCVCAAAMQITSAAQAAPGGDTRRASASTYASLESWMAAAPGEVKAIDFKGHSVGDFPKGQYAATHGISFDAGDIVKETSQFPMDRKGINGQGPSALSVSGRVVGVAVDYPHGLYIEAYNQAQESIFRSENQGANGQIGQFFGVFFDEVPRDILLHDWTNHIVDYDTLYLAYEADPCQIDEDEDGFTLCDGDCDDGDAALSPAAAEVLDDTLDNDCDGEVDEGGCGACSLSVASANPSGEALPADGSATLLHFKISNTDNPEALNVTALHIDLSWPEASASSAQVSLASDPGCDGQGDGQSTTRGASAGALTFSRSDTIAPEGSACYVLTAAWLGAGCPGCGEASARISPEGVEASVEEAVSLAGAPVSGSLALPSPRIEDSSEIDGASAAGEVVVVEVTLEGACPEGWSAHFAVCGAPDAAEGVALGEALEADVPFEADGTAAATLTLGDRPGVYKVCVTPEPVGGAVVCEVEPVQIEVQVSGLTVLARHDGDEGLGVGTFVSGIEAPNVFEVRLDTPAGDERTLARVDFDLDGAPVSVVQAPFAVSYDMGLAALDSVLTVSAELSDGAVVEESFEVLALPIATWVEHLRSLGAQVDTGWQPDDERYGFQVEDFPGVRASGTVPEDIPLLGGQSWSARLGYDLNAHFYITRASDFTGEVQATGQLAGQPFELRGEAFAAFDKEMQLLPGAFAKARSELRVTGSQTLLGVAGVPLLDTTAEVQAVVSSFANLHSFSMTTFDRGFGVEDTTLVPEMEGVYRATTALIGNNGLAELGASLKVCFEVDSRFSTKGGDAELTTEHFGGAVQLRADLVGSLFWGPTEGAAQLGGVGHGPFEFGDGLFDGGAVLSRCDGEAQTPFLPKVSLSADGQGRVLLVRTRDTAAPGEAPNPELVMHLNAAEGFGPEVRITDNTTWEMDPDATLMAGGEAVAVWTSNAAARETTSLRQIFAAQEISAAFFDGQAWGPEVQLTDDDEADGVPQIAYDLATHTVLAVWVRDSGAGDPADRSGYSLRYATFDPTEGAWSVAQTVPGTDGGAFVFHPRVVSNGGGVFVVSWVQDGDGQLFQAGAAVQGGQALTATSGDTDLKFTLFEGGSFGSPARLSPQDDRIELSASLSRRGDGHVEAAWVSRGLDGDRLEVARIDLEQGSADAPETLDAGGVLLESPRLMLGDDARGHVIYRKLTGDDDELFVLEVDVAAEVGPGGRASPRAVAAEPRRLTRDGGVSWAPAVAQDSSGTVWVAWSRLDADEGPRGGIAERLSEGIHVAPIGGAPSAGLLGEGRLRERLDVQGRIEALELELDLDVRRAGSFTVQASVFDSRGRKLGDALFEAADADEGLHVVGLTFDGRDLREGGVPGPFTVGDITVVDNTFSPSVIGSDPRGLHTGSIPLEALVPSRLDTGRDLFIGEDDSMTLTVEDERFDTAPQIRVSSSTLSEPLFITLPQVGPGRYQATLGFSTEAGGDDVVLVAPTGVVHITYPDPGGRDWTSPVTWVPPSPQPHALDVEVSPPRAGVVVGEGIACPRDCFQTVIFGERVTLSAQPAQGWELAGWTGGECRGAGDCSFVMTADSVVTARFTEVEQTPTQAPQTPTPAPVTPEPTPGPTPPEGTGTPSPAPATQSPAPATPTPAAPGPISTGGDDDGAGCGCGSPSGGPSPLSAALLALVPLGVRRRRS